MPEMSGYDSASTIRRSFLPERQPTIYALTAHAFEEEKERCLQSGMKEVCRISGMGVFELLIVGVDQTYQQGNPSSGTLKVQESKLKGGQTGFLASEKFVN